MQEIRYAGRHNFTGEPVPGYRQPACLLTRPAALAVHAAQHRARDEGYGLEVYDCYRPQAAVNHFLEWSEHSEDQRAKGEFYPAADKSRLFRDGYVTSGPATAAAAPWSSSPPPHNAPTCRASRSGRAQLRGAPASRTTASKRARGSTAPTRSHTPATRA